MEKLIIERKPEDIYRIAIEGGFIEFDLADISLGYKVNKAFEDVSKTQERVSSELNVIEKKYINQPVTDVLKRQKEQEEYQAIIRMFNRCREIMDDLLGKGVMDKIFGEHNYWDMYNDLFEALEPHFKKMELNASSIKDRLEAKYGRKDTNVIK